MLDNTKRGILSIETERLKVCESESHLKDVEAVLSDEKTMFFIRSFWRGVKMGAEAFVEILKNAGVYTYPLALKDTKEIVGVVTLNNIDVSCKRIEVGYFLLSSHWKKGYAREILNAMVDFLKKQGWHRIEATVYSGNDASQKVLEVCGFTLEGVLRDKYVIHGKYHDDIVYSIINK